MDGPEFGALDFLTLVMLTTGTLFYRQAEGWSLPDPLYFFYICVGLGVLPAFVEAVAERRKFLEEDAVFVG